MEAAEEGDTCNVFPDTTNSLEVMTVTPLLSNTTAFVVDVAPPVTSIITPFMCQALLPISRTTESAVVIIAPRWPTIDPLDTIHRLRSDTTTLDPTAIDSAARKMEMIVFPTRIHSLECMMTTTARSNTSPPSSPSDVIDDDKSRNVLPFVISTLEP